ncbi:hypothetical protein YJ57_24735 [Salmonella enterica subsp. enterica]|nr:hypothetical protein [Salmonella enterica subsp. enterica]EDV1534389.1 DotA/TraY family protein [Salmonella enterica subsp. enterica]
MKKIYLLMGILLITLIPDLAHANMFTPVESNWLVNNVFDKITGDNGANFSDASALAGVSRVFLSALMCVGGILAFYTLLAGTMNTAHDGEFMGKKWSSVWIPIRTSIGVALIIPNSTGFCVIQIIILKLALMGMGLADNAWQAFGSDPMKGMVYTATKLDGQIRPLFQQMTRANACAIAVNLKVSDMQKQQENNTYTNWLYTTGKNTNKVPHVQGVPFTNEGGKITGINYSDINKHLDSPDGICGSVQMDLTDNTDEDYENSAAGKLNGLVNLSPMRKALTQAHIKALSQLNTRAEALANKLVLGGVTSVDMAPFIKAAVDEYSKTINETAKANFDSITNPDATSMMTEDGWVGAGAWYFKIAMASNAVQSAVSNIPTATTEEGSETGIFRALREYKNYVDPARNRVDELFSAAERVGEVGVARSKQEDNLFNTLLNTFTIKADNRNVDQHPLMFIQDYGRTLITIASVAGGLAAGASLGAAVPFLGNIIVAASAIMAPIFSMVFFMFILPGITLAYYLPMMPFIIWIGVITGWVVLFVEALFASPLWAMAFLAPDADGFVGKQGQGYMLILSLVLRPILAIIGFVASMALIVPLTGFVNHFYQFVANSISGTGLFNIVASFSFSLIYCAILINLWKRLLSLSHTIPDTILQWIGGHAQNVMGQYANGIEGTTDTMNKMGAGAAVSSLKSGSAHVGGVLSKFRSNNSENPKAGKKGQMGE